MKGPEEDKNKKKDYLIAKALHKFMWASILASVASQIAMTTDAIVVSQFIGPEAISAINLTMPVVIFFNFLMMLFGMGGSVLVAKSLGERDAQTTNNVFTSTLIGLVVVGVFFSALLLIFSPQVASFITNDTPVVYTLSLRYHAVRHDNHDTLHDHHELHQNRRQSSAGHEGRTGQQPCQPDFRHPVYCCSENGYRRFCLGIYHR
jgi:Na+-driven multidrug efflux pump